MKWDQLDFYRKALLIMFPLAFILLIYFLITHPWNLLRAEWFLDLIIVPTFFGTLVSGAGYVGRTIDAISSKSAVGLAERVGTCLGFVCGAVVGMGLILLGKVIPFVGGLHFLAKGVFTLFSISSFAGLGQRFGSFIDNNTRPKIEKRAMILTALAGLAAGLALFFTHHAALVCVAGVTSFFTGGVALPFILCGIIFATTFSGLCASSADYFSKAGSYLRIGSTQDSAIKNTVSERFHEYKGAFVGTSLGLIVGAVIIGALVMTQPYLLAGVAGLLVAAIIITACVSVLGGLCSRVGRLLDSRNKIKKPGEVELTPLMPKKQKQLEIVLDKQTNNLSRKPACQVSVSPVVMADRDRHSVRALIAKSKTTVSERKDMSNTKIDHSFATEELSYLSLSSSR